MKFDTKIVRAGERPEKVTGALTTPIYQTSTYVLDRVGQLKGKDIWREGFDYSRANHPTKAILEQKVNELEGGKGCVAFASGMAAITALMLTLNTGDHIIFSEDVYGGIHRLLTQIMSRFRLESDFIDTNNFELVERKIKDNTRMIFIETPTNPLLIIYDIKKLAKISKEHSIPFVVDNTFMTPYLQKPLEMGAETVVHSLTKYLSGHNDLIGGAIVSKNKDLLEELAFIEKSTGSLLGPLDSYLTIRGIKTLAVRMERHNHNAMAVARFLESNPKMKRVIYPGLENHPQFGLAKKQMTGFGGIVTFEVENLEKAKRVMESVNLWYLATSLGGVESMIAHPVTMTHNEVPEKERQKRGLSDGLMRLSVGIENVDDLTSDLAQALEKI